MRALSFAIALSITGCAYQHALFRPALREQAVEGQPDSAIATADGIRATVHAGDWRGSPKDLEEHLTPVEVLIENGSGRALAIQPEHFVLINTEGFRYQAMDPREVQRMAASYRGEAAYVGLYGAYPWPGFWRPWRPGFYPYVWWDWFGPPYPYYWGVSPPERVQPQPTPRGVLEPGGSASVLLFFPIPSVNLTRFVLTADLVDEKGARIGTIRVPLVRAGKEKEKEESPPAAAKPPTPPPRAPPPPPAGPPGPPPGSQPAPGGGTR